MLDVTVVVLVLIIKLVGLDDWTESPFTTYGCPGATVLSPRPVLTEIGVCPWFLITADWVINTDVEKPFVPIQVLNVLELDMPEIVLTTVGDWRIPKEFDFE